MLKPERLKRGDVIGIIAPSRPIKEKEILPCIKILEDRGFKVKLGKNLYKKSYYSAGDAKERASDLNAIFKDNNIIFLEAKHFKKDKLTQPQLKFIKGALDCGISSENFLIIEWDFKE
ncbi:MAG: LD-carboxypeptidase [Candidatus Paceibacterota bacterium]|jgi:hypothetical protein